MLSSTGNKTRSDLGLCPLAPTKSLLFEHNKSQADTPKASSGRLLECTLSFKPGGLRVPPRAQTCFSFLSRPYHVHPTTKFNVWRKLDSYTRDTRFSSLLSTTDSTPATQARVCATRAFFLCLPTVSDFLALTPLPIPMTLQDTPPTPTLPSPIKLMRAKASACSSPSLYKENIPRYHNEMADLIS